jgi:hypothetical protein
MSVPIYVDPSLATLTSTRFRVVSGNLCLDPRDAAGNQVSFYIPGSATSNTPNKGLTFSKEVISGNYCVGNWTKAYEPSIKFGSACIEFMAQYGTISLPGTHAFQGVQKFTLDMVCKFTTTSGVAYLVNDCCNVWTVDQRWYLVRSGDKLSFVVYSADNSTTVTTSGLTLDTTSVWRIRLIYDGTPASGSCAADICAAVDGAALQSYIHKTDCVKVATLTLPNVPGLRFGGYEYDGSGYNMPYGADVFYLNEAIGYANLNLGTTDTPSTTVLTPFTTTATEATFAIDLGSGQENVAWDLSRFYEGQTVDAAYTFRVAVGNTAPSLSGSSLTQAQVQALTGYAGRYGLLGIKCTDAGGLTDHLLPPGIFAGIVPNNLVFTFGT